MEKAERITISKTEDQRSKEASIFIEQEHHMEYYEEEASTGTEKELHMDEDEEEMECGFCLFMKGGGCKENFIAWEKCVEDAEKNKEDIVEKCFEVTGQLKRCMEAHADYYEPILRAEKVMEEEAKQELDLEPAAAGDSQATLQEAGQKGQSGSAPEEKETKQELDREQAAGDSQETLQEAGQKGQSGSAPEEKEAKQELDGATNHPQTT